MSGKGWIGCCLIIWGIGLVGCAQDDVSGDRDETAVPTTAATSEITAVPPDSTPDDLFEQPTQENGRVLSETIPEVTATPPHTPSPPPLKSLTICQAAEPDSLFLYSTAMLDKTNLHHTIYENLITQQDFGYQAQGIEKLPNLADGDAYVQIVTAQAGDRVVDADGEVVTLAAGVVVLDENGRSHVFEGTPLDLPQLVVEFTLRPMVWSDGTPVSAADSVFSFSLNRDVSVPFTTADSFRAARTASYEATGALTLRWTGLPGWQDPTYFLNVWPPLPQHHLGDIPLDALAEAPAAARTPLASGPFRVTAWQPGSQIQLTANPHYYRAAAGLPKLDQLIFRFVPDSNQLVIDLLAGRCDVGTQSAMTFNLVPLLRTAVETGDLIPTFTPTLIFEHLDFGINSYADYGDGNGRPDWFEDARVRQALAMCTDRQWLVDEVMLGVSEIWDAYAPPRHPLLPDDVAAWPYEPATARALLDEAGYRDIDGDGVREDPGSGAPFAITLITTSGAELRPHVVSLLALMWAECGVQVNEQFAGAETFFAEGLEGPVFGRQFDVALFAWLGDIAPACGNWQSVSIPGPAAEDFGGWNGRNVTGWSDPQFDAACAQAQRAYWGTEAFVEGHQQALRIFAESLPSLPLFPRVKMAAARAQVRGLDLDPTQPSELWNVAEMDVVENGR